MRSSTSPQILSAEVRNMSSVWLTVPSLEFSIGTDAKVGHAAFDLLEYLIDGTAAAARAPMSRNA